MRDLKLLSVNQLNDQSKLQKVWKSINIKDYPITWEKYQDAGLQNQINPERNSDGPGIGMKMQASFYSDSTRLWNNAPDSMKNCKSLICAKKEIKKFVFTLPI